MSKTVYVVHCIDTEGPLYESLETKFERINDVFGISGIAPTKENFQKLCKGELDLGGKEENVQQMFSSHLADFMDDWGKLDEMLDRAMSDSFRKKSVDSFGGGYIYNWFCVDHVGYLTNPRRRTLGFHEIFDHYNNLLKAKGEKRDGLHWHMHPLSTYKEANRCATSLLNSPEVFEGLARRIIERKWFPSSYRAGFQTERPDIHWFLEQYIPFDFSNTSLENPEELEAQADLADGRFGDWRLAPKDWGVYHPSHDNYQLKGNCRRWIARSLNVLNRFANINDFEVEKAFKQASEGKSTLLSISSHDFRDLTTEADYFRKLILKARKKYPSVQFKFSEAAEAMRQVALGGKTSSELILESKLIRDKFGKPEKFVVETKQGQVFGPQPYFAVKTKSKRFIHDNLDFSTSLKSWHYTFDAESILPDDVDSIGVGASDEQGFTSVNVIDVNKEMVTA